ncbi:MAG: LamG domain-containing protein, partial [Solirubrobacteraceae bacterium]
SAEHYGGTIDEAAIYNTALSATRIADHYIAGRSYRDVVGDDDPVSYWRLGETAGTAAADQQAANAGTYVGSPALNRTGAPAGDADRSPLFNGTTQYVNVPDSASLDTLGNAGITLEIWAKRSSTTGTTDINLFSKGCDAAELTINATSGLVQFWKSCVVNTAPLATSTAAGDIDDTEWHHIVATKAGTTSKLYVDGVDVTVIGTDSTLAATNVALRIGAWDSGGSLFDFFPGRLDEAAVYSRALSATEVKLHYNAGKDSPR